MRSVASVLTASLVLLLAGCGDDPSGPPFASFTGAWHGSLAGAHFEVEIGEESDGEFVGTGSMAFGIPRLSITVAGSHDHPNVEFTGYAVGYENIEFSGQFEAADTVRGRVNGSGYTNETLYLFRD